MKHKKNSALHPSQISRGKANGGWRVVADPQTRVETLSIAEQVKLSLLLESNPNSFKAALQQWRAANPTGQMNIGGAGGTLSNLDLTGFTPGDFDRIQLTGLTFEMPTFPDEALHQALVEKGVKFREGYTIGERVFAKPLALHTIARRDMELNLESDPADFKKRMARLREDHEGRAIDLGGICVYRGDFTTLTAQDFQSVLLKGSVIGDVILPNDELYQLLIKKGLHFEGSVTIGDRIIPAPLQPDATDRSLIQNCLESGAREGFLGHLARLRNGNPERTIDFGSSIDAFMPKLTGFKPQDFDGIQLRACRFREAKLADDTMKKCLESKGAVFTGAVTVAGLRTMIAERSRF